MIRIFRNIAAICYLAVIIVIVSFSIILSQEVKPTITEALKKGDTALAVDLLHREIEIDKSYHLNYFTLGMISFNQNRYKDAVDQFNQALDRKSKHFESLYWLGLSYLKLGDLDNAQEAMEKGRKKDKKEKHRFEDGYGQVMLARKNWQEADRVFRQALVGNPDNATYHIHLGDANFYQGIPSLAILEYEKALEVDTASLEVYFHWAEACLEMKDFNCAIEKLKIVLTKDSTYALAWMRAGGIYFKAARSSRARQERIDRFKETIGAYKRYLELSDAQPDSSNVRVFYELAMSYVNLHGYDDASGYFEKVLSIPIEPKDIYFYYGKALWGIKDFVKSVEVLLKHIEWVGKQSDNYSSNIKDYELYQLLGDGYYYRNPKDFSTAIEYYKKSVEDKPNQKRLVQNIAVGYHSLKSYDQALEYYQKRIEFGIDSSSASILKNAGYCAMNIANNTGDDEDEELDEEETRATFAGAIDPNLNYYEVAISYMEEYLKYKSDEKRILLLVANTYLYQLSDCANGVKYFELILTLEPNNCDAKKSLGYAYFGGVCNKNYTKALKYLIDAHNCIIADKGACADEDLILWVAQCYHLRAAAKQQRKQDANDDFKNAFNWYGKCLKCDPSNTDCKKGQDDVRFEFVD